MISEAEFVLSAFKRHFYRGQKMAIYGLGRNTKAILDAFPECDIVGLMDQERTGETVWGLPVLDCAGAHAMGVQIILILARASNVPIIYPRIAADCEKWRIAVYDINGRRVETNLQERKVAGFSRREGLMRTIAACDVVSFDLFDTLLMRKVIESTDVFRMVERKARRGGIIPPGFPYARRRIRAERGLSLAGHPMIYDIYWKMVADGDLASDVADLLLAMELDEEEHQLIPRQEMVDVLEAAKGMGKIVCCTSDMYLTGNMLRQMLRINGVDGLDQIFVSCEHGATKSEGLLGILGEHYSGARILHVDDNEVDGLRFAAPSNVQLFFIPSARKMLGESAARELVRFSGTLDERNEIGRFAARQFANPFLFEQTGGRCRISSCYAMGHDFVEPLVSCFVHWLIGRCREDGIEMLLLGARDGWLIKGMLDEIRRAGQIPFAYSYIYCSRVACTLAGVQDEGDVMYAASLPFAGTAEEMLRARFQLEEGQVLSRETGEGDEAFIRRHAGIILGHAVRHRANYREYLHAMGIREGQRIAFFDLVSSGTCQFWLEKILGVRMQGYYFIRLLDERKSEVEISPFFQEACMAYSGTGCHLLSRYFLMEELLSSFEPSLRCIAKEGKPIFAKETRTEKQLHDLREIHRGIMDAFLCRLSEGDGVFAPKELADVLFSYIHKDKADIQMDYFVGHTVQDDFCNRVFDLEGIIEH